MSPAEPEPVSHSYSQENHEYKRVYKYDGQEQVRISVFALFIFRVANTQIFMHLPAD